MKAKLPTWYEQAIEEPVRDFVRLLRDNGFNTYCSCGHEMFVELDLIPDGELERLHTLLYNYFYMKLDRPPEYEIIVRHRVVDGHCVYTRAEVKLPKGTKKRGR